MDSKPDAPDSWSPAHDDIARLAYSYHQGRGYTHGSHEEDWHRAVEELRQRRGADASATRTVVGVFHAMDHAQQAFEELRKEGFSGDEISLIANKAGSANPADTPSPEAGAGSEVAADAGIGAAMGGAGGLLLSLAGLAVPGIGPVLAAGPIVAALGGAGVGAAAGGLVGALTEHGIPEMEAGHYAEGVRRGDVIVAVNASGVRAGKASEILDRNGASDIGDRVSQWKQRGWTAHDTNAQPLTSDELRREREYFESANEQAREWSREATAGAETRRASRVYERT